jgi:hypothetical protein
MLETIHARLSQRVPVATELYVIGCEYIPVSISIAVSLMDGFGQETVLAAVRDAVRLFLWPLPGGGADGLGWRLGRSVRDRELDVIVSRVPGVDTVNGLNLFQQVSGLWQQTPVNTTTGTAEISLQQWQLPELLHVFADAGLHPAATVGLDSQGPIGSHGNDIGVPVVPEVC